MNLNVQSIRFTADQKLINFVHRRAAKLSQYLDQIIDGICYLRLENVEDEMNKVSEFKINIPGNQLFAKAQAKTFEEATDLALESLRRQINKYKTKNRTNVSNHKELLSNSDSEEFA